MSARLKFNMVMAAVLAVAVGIAGYVLNGVLHQAAREQVLQSANLLMAAAQATRAYTTTFIKPHLDQRLDVEFLPQTVPAFAATETIIALRKQFPEFAYKEAVLNPTNPRDRTADWEADVVSLFRSDPARTQVLGERMQGPVQSLYFAKPIRITEPSCLSCHSTPSAAPASMIKLYGEANGFGWKLDEVIGAQIVSVPLATAEQAADRIFLYVMAALAGIALLALGVGNLMFGRRNP